MERIRYPSWISPLFGIMAVGFFILALGGVGPILGATVTYQVVLAALACVGVGFVVMVALEWWNRRISPPTGPADAIRRGNRRLVVMVVVAAIGSIIVRSAYESPSSIVHTVGLGLFAGLFLGGAIVLPFDKRRPLPFEALPKDRQP